MRNRRERRDPILGRLAFRPNGSDGAWGIMVFSVDGLRIRMARLLAAGGTRRQMAGTVLAGLILGLGSVTIGTSLVHASERDGLAGFFQMLFGGARQADVAPPPRPIRYSNLPRARTTQMPRPILHTPRPRVALLRPDERRTRKARSPAIRVASHSGDTTVCVRLCDGYLFPLGRLRSRSDMPVHELACSAACPNAATSVYTLSAGESDLDRAVSPQGMPYRASALANIYRQRRVENCSCQPAGEAMHVSLSEDLTLRRGDVVATATSADVVTLARAGSVETTDFRRARLPGGYRRQIEARVGALQRDEQARSFRRVLRVAAREGTVRLAGADDGFRLPARPTGAILPVRVVAPSPFLR